MHGIIIVLALLFSSTFAGATPLANLTCLYLFSTNLNTYIRNSEKLPAAFNVLALRDFQRAAGLPRFAKLDERFVKSFHKTYGKKDSNQIELTLGSPIQEELGTGWLSRVVSLENGRVFKLIIREGNRTSNIGILFETEAWVTYHLQENEASYGIKVLPILGIGPNGMYLEKPPIDKKTIGNHILKAKRKLTSDQTESLRKLYLNAVRLAKETGIPLDIKSDNMFWNGSEWIVLDPIGSIDYKAYRRPIEGL